MSYTAITFEKKKYIACITINCPDANNTLNRYTAGEIEEACVAVNGDDKVYVVIVTGTGKTFCGGTEIVDDIVGTGPAAFIAGIEKPVIAAVNGDAVGQGLEIALSCDIRLAAEGAKFGLPQAAQGYIPLDGGTQRLPRIVGKGKALELLLTADTISAEEALEIGLVSNVVSDESLADEAWKLAETIAGKGPLALKYLKEAVIKGMDMTMEQGLRLEADLYFLLHTTVDRMEGIEAFREKREPKFRGE